MSLDTLNIESFRIASQMFSKTTILNIVKKGDCTNFEYYSSLFNFSNELNNKTKIKKIYKLLLNNYRCEYVYKNNLLNSLLKKYKLKDSVVFNEITISNSIADVMYINGVCKIYEIKSEFDSVTKLYKQINDYRKVSEIVYIVCGEKLLEKVKYIYNDSNIGILVFSKKNVFEEIKSPTIDKSNFCFDALFKLLRKTEYIRVYKTFYSDIPNLPNTIVFNFCYQNLKKIAIDDFQSEVMRVLKERKSKYSNEILSSKLPNELKYICNSIRLNDNEVNKLYEFLNF